MTRSLENVEPRKFTNQIKLELLEQDRGRDDFLGEKVIDDKPAGFGVRSIDIAKPGVAYNITVEVR